jgi:hypothetical protein
MQLAMCATLQQTTRPRCLSGFVSWEKIKQQLLGRCEMVWGHIASPRPKVPQTAREMLVTHLTRPSHENMVMEIFEYVNDGTKLVDAENQHTGHEMVLMIGTERVQGSSAPSL